MKRKTIVVVAIALSFVAGLLLANLLRGVDPAVRPESDASGDPSSVAEDTVALALPVAAQAAWFPPISQYETDGEVLGDQDFDELLALLADRLEDASGSADFDREAKVYLYGFVRRVTLVELTEDQVAKAAVEFERFSERYPEQKALFDQWGGGLENFAKASDTVMPFALAEKWFPLAEDYDTGGRPFSDDTISELIGMLDVLLEMPETVADFDREARIHFFAFMRALQFGVLTGEHKERITAYLDQVSARQPEADELLDNQRFFVNNLLPGNEAPNIVGNDINGVEFELHDYLGDVVAIYFSGEWCGPCRGEYPYKRLMLEIFDGQPVTILGVNSDEDLETVREMKETERLDYRVWWDGHGEVPTEGPIATAWSVVGWPTIFVLDQTGTIRYTQKRNSGVIQAVSDLLVEGRERKGNESAAE